MKKLCLITTARSDFGILRPLIKRLDASRNIDVKVVVTGQHAFSQADRSSLAEIEHARVSIHAIIDPEISGSRQVDISDAVATICSKFGKYLERERPKAVIVLGDRYELMGLVSAAVIFNIPIIHLHGGELSLGAIDNQIRNAVTQFADLHFTATKSAAKRVSIMTGSENIYFTGSLSVEELKSLKVMDRLDLFEYLKIDKCLPSAIITFHPETTTPVSTLKNLDSLLSLVAVEMSGFNIVVTMPNADHLNVEFCF